MTLNSRPALQTALAHRSIRRFSAEPVSAEMLAAVLEAARASSTSSYLQNCSIIRVTDPAIRKELRAVCAAEGGAGHAYVEHCAEFLVFCIDAARHHALDDAVQTDWTEVLLIGAIDAGIMAQSMVLAAESLGLGAVYIGSIRNDIARVGSLLGLPEYVVPLFGVCLGHPDQDPLQRPRLPLDTLVSENRYRPAAKAVLDDYNETVKSYYRERSGKDLDWAQQVSNTLARPVRPFVSDYLRKQGFAKR
ncbi:MAG: oxygen-insensitive NADPH nitroreductase [Neisseria sp.]|nr:oxygen-insensitive NADPH nitroreductase [Neisseria sp.]